MPQHNKKKDRFDQVFDKRFNRENTLLTPESVDLPTPDITPADDSFNQAFNLRFEQRQQESFDPFGAGYDIDSARAAGLQPDETGHMPSRVPETGLILKGRQHPTFHKTVEAEKELGFEFIEKDGRLFSFPKEQLPETPLTPDQEFSEIVSPQPPKEKPSFFSRVKESFLKAQGALARTKTKPIKKLGTLLRKAGQVKDPLIGASFEDLVGVAELGAGREAARRKVSQAGDLIKKHREGTLEAKDIVDFFRPDKNLKDFWEELKKVGREGAVFGVTFDDKKVPQELQFRSFVTEFNKLAFQDIGLPESVEIAITPLGLRGPTITLKTLVTILGFSAEILDPSILGVSIFGKAFKVKELTAVQRALKAGDDLAETQLSALLKMDEALGIAGKERAEAALIKEIKGFGVETPAAPAFQAEKPGPFKRVQAEEIPEPGVPSLAARIARDEEGFSADELQVQTNFPNEIEAEIKTLRKGENLAPDEPLPTLTRQDLENQIRDLGLPKERAEAQIKILDFRAKAWSRLTGRNPDEWFSSRVAGVKRSVQADLNKEEALFQDFQSGNKQIEVLDKEGLDLANLSGDFISTNSDGTVTLFHRTHPKAAERIRETGKFLSREQGEVFFSTNEKGQAFGFGDEIISVKVNPNKIRLDDAFGDEIHVAINSNDIGKENLTDTDVLFQKPQELIQDSSPVFYSTLRNTIEDKMPGRADVTTIRGLVKNIKKEEMQWSGLDDYLAGREGDKITKDEVLDFLKENQIRIEETLKGGEINPVEAREAIELVRNQSDEMAEILEFELEEGNNLAFVDRLRSYIDENSFLSDIEREALESIEIGRLPVRYGDYQLPGGENYKEMLLRLPVKGEKFSNNFIDFVKRLSSKYGHSYNENQSPRWNWGRILDKATIEEGKQFSSFLRNGGPTPEAFRSAHWEEPNVLSHVRFNERNIEVASNVNEKTLFIEEIQSDWMQAGRKRGFNLDENDSAALVTTREANDRIRNEQLQNKIKIQGEGIDVESIATTTGFLMKRKLKVEKLGKSGLFQIRDIDVDEIIPNNSFVSRSAANERVKEFNDEGRPMATINHDVTDLEKFGKVNFTQAGLTLTARQKLLIEEFAILKRESRRLFLEMETLTARAKSGVPNAPFKTTWHEMSMRRMIRYAADNNFDRIGWTTGVQQADRYNLANAVERIVVSGRTNAFFKDAHREVNIVLQSADSLVVGVDKTGKITHVNARADALMGKQLDEALGRELADKIMGMPGGGTIQGEGLTIGGEGMKFFYDKMLVNYAKKFGKKFGAEVEDVKIETGTEFVNRTGFEDAPPIAEEQKIETIHSMKITNEMKRSVREKGVPLFQDAKGAVEFLEGEQRAFIHLFESGDISTLGHEFAHVFLQDLYRTLDEALPEFRVQIEKDIAATEKWMGIKDRNITTEAAEKWARGWERWLREGVAPNSELKKIFEQFKEWLTEIYRVIKGGDLDVRLNEDIRQVFDNLLGGKELGDFTGKTARRAPSDLPAPITDIIGIGTGGIRMRPNTDFFKGELREEIAEIRKVLHKKFPGKKIFVEQGGETLDEIATRRGITEDELNQELLRIDTDKDKLETFRAQAEEAFQRPVSVNNKGELIIDGTVLFQKKKTKNVFKRVLFQEAPGLSPGQRKKAIGKLQIEKFSKEAKEVIEESIKVFGKDIRAQRRGKRSIAVTKQAATQEKQLIIDALNGKIKPGTAFNSEEIQALGSAVDGIGKKLAKDTKLMDNPVTMHLFTNLFKVFSGGSTELGRGMRQLREIRAGHDFDVFRIIKKKAVELDAEISKIIDKEVPTPSLMNQIVELARNVKLMAASSLVRSFVGNLSMQVFKFAETGISPVYNKILSVLTGKSQDRFLRELTADFMGMKSGISEGLQSARGILAENADALAESAFLQREFGKTMRAIPGPAGKVIRIGQNAQGAIDAIFRVPAIEGRIRVHAWRQALQENLTGNDLFNRVDELIEDIPNDKKLMERILEEARQQTFQKQLGAIGRGINAARQAEGGFLQLFVPFFNTAANLFKEFVARTPLAIVTKSFWMDASKMWRPGEIGLASDALAKITSGTLFSYTVYVTVNEIFEGRIIGRGPSSLNERNLLRRSGWMPYSVRVGDTYYSYMGFEPMSSFLGALADFHEGKKEAGLVRGFSKAFENVAATFADNPFLQGVSDFADLLQGRKNLNQFLSELAVGMVMPSIVRQTAKVIDPTLKVKRDGSLPENIRDGFVAVTPWLSKNLEDRFSPLGEKIVRQNALGNLFAIKISKESNDPVVKELINIGFFPGSGSRYQNINLTEKEKNELNEIAGKQLYKTVLMFLSNPEWKTLDKAEKVKIIRNNKNRIFDLQKSMLFGESGELLTKNPINKSLTSAQLKVKKNQRALEQRKEKERLLSKR